MLYLIITTSENSEWLHKGTITEFDMIMYYNGEEIASATIASPRYPDLLVTNLYPYVSKNTRVPELFDVTYRLGRISNQNIRAIVRPAFEAAIHRYLAVSSLPGIVMYVSRNQFQSLAGRGLEPLVLASFPQDDSIYCLLKTEALFNILYEQGDVILLRNGLVKTLNVSLNAA